ncbi:universal stress protein [Saccharopolyspora sp. 5N102]|uniref:universal stress protein n=1 Tax=Saccharopolyspora sp. 5N102 TaxID=3375155 RepID=UPI0037924D53
MAQRGHPVAELAAAAEDARLLVVGHRGRGGFTGLLLGSVAAGVLHHASCPVAVVRAGGGAS